MIERTEKLRTLRHAVPAAEEAVERTQDALRDAVQEQKDYRRELVIEKTQEILADEPLVLTLGTTGTDDCRDRICEVVLMERDGRAIFHALVKPDKPVSAESTEFHGLTDDMLEEALEFREVLEGYIETAEGRRIIAWNGKFEREFLRCESERADVSPSTVPAPREADEWRYVRDRELDSISWLFRDLNDSEVETHGSNNPTPVGVARTIWKRLEEIVAPPEPEYEDFDDVPF